MRPPLAAFFVCGACCRLFRAGACGSASARGLPPARQGRGDGPLSQGDRAAWLLPAGWQRGQCAAVTTCGVGHACNADCRGSRKGRALQRSRLGKETVGGAIGAACGQAGNEPPCSDYAQRSRENGRRADSMRCCCGSSIRHRPKYGRERKKSLPVGGACGQRSRPLCCRGKIKEKPYGKFFSLRRRHWPGGNGGPAGFVRRCVVFRVLRDGFCWRQNLLCGDRTQEGATSGYGVSAGNTRIFANAGALQVVCTLILPDGTVESVVAFFWSAVVWQMWAGTGAGWTS